MRAIVIDLSPVIGDDSTTFDGQPVQFIRQKVASKT
jgi:hypothetical protein